MKYINDIPILFIIITLACYIPLRLIYIKRKKIKLKLSKEISLILFIAYAESLLYLTLFPSTSGIPQNEVRANLVPFQTINLYLNYHDSIPLQIINLVGNVVVFIPIGIFVPLFLKKVRWITILLIGFGSTMFIELMQLLLSLNRVISRSFDVDDLILNTIGVLIGYCVHFIMMKLIMSFRNRNTR